MKSFSKRVASFTMAAAMVLSLAAVSPVDAQAAKKASIAKKTSITAGKTYTYKIKNVTSKQYVKVTGITSGVTVKYNNKKVKKNSTKIYGKKSGAALALKVTAKDKIANYKATIKAQVYNKSNNKKVGSLLKTTTTVKCTKLKVTSVESAATSGKYLVATFNKALSKLSVADITIRNKETGELKGVANVELASNGKSATITLAGAEDSNNFIEPNVDYTFAVSQSGVTATTSFIIDAVMASASVINTDATNRALTLANPTDWTQYASRVVVPSTISVDFQEILGATVTVWFDKNNNVTKLTRAKETVKYATVKAADYSGKSWADCYLENVANGEKYFNQVQSGNLKNTAYVEKTNAGYVSGNVIGSKVSVAYAKITFNSNGTMKTVVYDKNCTKSILVDKVADTVVSAGTKTVVNLKDYLIIKDGKTIALSDIAAGDVVFYDTTTKFAEVYNDAKTADLQAVYKDEYKFNDVVYKTANVSYVDGSNGVKTANDSYMNSLLKGGPSVTVYFNRANQPVFIKGTAAGVTTNTTTVVLTDDVKAYENQLDKFIRFTGFNGKEKATYNVNVADLKTVKVENGDVYEVANKTDETGKYYGKSFQLNNYSGNEGKNAYITYTNNSGTSGLSLTGHTDFAAEIVKTEAIELTTNDAGKVVGIAFKSNAGTVSGEFVAGKTNVATGAGKAYQIGASTPIYAYNNSDNTVSKVDYSAFKGAVANGNAVVYSNDSKNVSYVVVFGVNDKSVSYVEAVVSTVKYNTDGKVVDLVAITGTTTTEYTAFGSKAKDCSGLKTGDIVRLGLADDGKTVQTIDKNGIGSTHTVTVSTNTVNQNDGTVKDAAGVDYTLATSVVPTIVKIKTDAQGITSLEVIGFNELANLDKATNQVDINMLATSDGETKFVDFIIVTK